MFTLCIVLLYIFVFYRVYSTTRCYTEMLLHDYAKCYYMSLLIRIIFAF